MNNRINKITTIIFIIMAIIFSISAAIIIPILFRPFYYACIKIFDIEKTTGYSYHQIKTAFDEMMDFIWAGKPFRTGDLAFSYEGMCHFRDCIFLFWLDLICFMVSLLYMCIHIKLVRNKIISFYNFFGFHPYFYSGIITVLFVLTIVIIASIDFYDAFIVFHKLFFPGKDNWEFDPDKDEIVRILPEGFFALCAGWIGSHILIFDISAISYGIIYKVKHKNHLKGDNNEGSICNQ